MGLFVQTISEILDKGVLGQEYSVYGWVRSVRDGKNRSFIAINDGSCTSNIQIVVDKSLCHSDLQGIITGCSVMVIGSVVQSPGKEQSLELHAVTVEIIGHANETYPLQKKAHTLEFLREIPHLRPRSNTIGCLTRIRSRLSFAIHSFFQERFFHYIHTPIITGNDCEGAGEMFQVTTTSEMSQTSQADSFFGKKTYLTVSGQLHLEAYCLALGRVYTFGPTFRAENSNTPRHLSEFWMIEPEIAFCNLDSNIQLGWDLLQYLIKDLLTTCQRELNFFEKTIKPGLIIMLENFLQSDIKILSYTEALKILEKSRKPFEYPYHWGADLKSEHERFICEKIVQGPVAIIDYPKEIKSFYMKLSEDQRTVRCVDILIPEIGEIIGGSQREDNLNLLQKRMVELNINLEDYQWYLDLRRYGSVPHSGFGLGLERLIMYVTGLSNIRDIIPFPRAPRTCIC